MRRLLYLLAATFLVIGVACGGGGGDDTSEPAAGDDEATEEATEAPSNELEFVATEFAFAGPETASAGELTITLTNQGEQPHVMAGFPLKEGAPSIEELAKLPEKEVQKYATGDLAGTLQKPVEPGQSETFTVDVSDAASFAYICYIQDPKTKKPHFQLGMLGSLTIE